jgi:glycosyltransferase involved in cell wall biosynthesis
VLDHGGPPELVSPETGIVVPLGSRAEIVTALRDRIAALANDRTRLAAMSARCIERVREHFTWDAKAARLEALYASILHPLRAPPSFPMPIGDSSPSPLTTLGSRAPIR